MMDTRKPTTDLALVAVFAALIAAFALVPAIPLPGIPVPITLQTLAVALTGLVLGPWRGALATLLYLAVGFAGLPVFAQGAAGLAVLGKPSAGYLISFPLAALVIGLVARLVVRARPDLAARIPMLFAAAMAGSLLVIHPFGIAGLMHGAHLTLAKAATVDLAFWVGDVVKSVLAAGVAATVHKAFPVLLFARPAVDPAR